MRVYLLNDKKAKALVYVDTRMKVAGILRPAEGRYFEVECREDQAIFVKWWEDNSVLLSTVAMDFDSLPPLPTAA